MFASFQYKSVPGLIIQAKNPQIPQYYYSSKSVKHPQKFQKKSELPNKKINMKIASDTCQTNIKRQRIKLDSNVTSYSANNFYMQQPTLQNKYIHILQDNNFQLASTKHVQDDHSGHCYRRVGGGLVGVDGVEQENIGKVQQNAGERKTEGIRNTQDFMNDIDADIMRKTKVSQHGSMKNVKYMKLEMMNSNADKIVQHDQEDMLCRFRSKMQKQIQDLNINLAHKLRQLQNNKQNPKRQPNSTQKRFTKLPNPKLARQSLHETNPSPSFSSNNQDQPPQSHIPQFFLHLLQTKTPKSLSKLLSSKSKDLNKQDIKINKIQSEIHHDKKMKVKNKFLSTICQNQVKKIMEIQINRANRFKNKCRDRYQCSTLDGSLPSIS